MWKASMAFFTGTLGSDSFIGTDLEADVFTFDLAALSVSDTISGGGLTSADAADTLKLMSSGVVNFVKLIHVAGIETIELCSTGNEIRVTHGLAATARNHRLTVIGQNGNDHIWSPYADLLKSADTLVVEAGGGHDTVRGGAGADVFQGRLGRDHLDGRGGHDKLFGGAGADLLTGGGGRDTIAGGAGNDVFHFRSLADSYPAAPDVIVDFGNGEDRIDLSLIELAIVGPNSHFDYIGSAQFSAPGQIQAVQSGSDTLVSINTSGTDGAEMSFVLKGVTASGLSALSFRLNTRPVAGDDIEATDEDTAATLLVLANDSDGDGDTLIIAAVGAASHGAVTVNPDSTITYVPDSDYFGSDSFGYTVSDGQGGTSSATVSIAIAPVNDAPVVATPLADKAVTTHQAFSFAIPVGSFTDVDGDSLTYSAELADGSPLPDWLAFDAAAGTFSGASPSEGLLSVNVTATDGQGGAVSDTFTLTSTTLSGSVVPKLETDVVAGAGDLADDPAIWINPENPTQSKIIATSKGTKHGGMYVFDLQGNTVDVFGTGNRYNNTDLRYGFQLGGETVELIGATNRTTSAIDFFTIDPSTYQLTKVGSVASGLSNLYGFTMYHAADGKFYAFATTTAGIVRQFELDASNGTVTGTAVRTFEVGSQAEGLAADDETGALYVGEEAVGIWKYGADPASGASRTLVEGVEAGHLAPDIEGLAIYYAADGSGYLLASSQGDSTFAVYDRGGVNAYLGSFNSIAGNGIDPVTSTDGIDVTNLPLGGAFSQGLLVVHDTSNPDTAANNYKLIAWEDIAALGNLIIDTAYNPHDGLLL
jgi:3-phytase